MMRKLILALAVLSLFPGIAQARIGFFRGGVSGGFPVQGFVADCGPPPPAAVTWGYTKATFCVTDISQLDLAGTKAPGFEFYTTLRGWLGGGSTDTVNFTGPMITMPASWFRACKAPDCVQTGTPGNGEGFEILPTSPGLTMTISSCLSNGEPFGWIGPTVMGGMYVEIAFYGVPTGKSALDEWWPVFWLFPVEALAQPKEDQRLKLVIEPDIFESMLAGGSWVAHYVFWKPTDGVDWTNGSLNFLMVQHQRDMALWGAPAPAPGPEDDPDLWWGFHRNHKYASLLVDPRDNGGVGRLDPYFMDGINPVNHSMTFSTSDPMDGLLTQENCVFVSTGQGQAMRIKHVAVWQSPSAGGRHTHVHSVP